MVICGLVPKFSLCCGSLFRGRKGFGEEVADSRVCTQNGYLTLLLSGKVKNMTIDISWLGLDDFVDLKPHLTMGRSDARHQF
jgi:hypothetical protein